MAWCGSSTGGALPVSPPQEQGLGCSHQSPPSREQVGAAWEGSHQQIHLGRCFTDCANPGVERGRNCSMHSQFFFLNKALSSIFKE